MIEIVNYVKPKSLKEAYELNQKKGNAVIGGMLWLKMQKKRVGTCAKKCRQNVRAAWSGDKSDTPW